MELSQWKFRLGVHLDGQLTWRTSEGGGINERQRQVVATRGERVREALAVVGTGAPELVRRLTCEECRRRMLQVVTRGREVRDCKGEAKKRRGGRERAKVSGRRWFKKDAGNWKAAPADHQTGWLIVLTNAGDKQ